MKIVLANCTLSSGRVFFPPLPLLSREKKQNKKKIVPSLPGSEVHYYVLIFDPLFPGRGRKTLQKKNIIWTRESGIQDDVFLFFEMLMQPRNFVGTLQMHRDFFFFLRVRKSFHCFIFPRCISTWYINGPDLGLEGGDKRTPELRLEPPVAKGGPDQRDQKKG